MIRVERSVSLSEDWLTKAAVINTLPLEKLRKELGRKRGAGN